MYAGEEAGDSSVAASSTRGKRGGSTTAASSHEKAFAREAKQARRALRHRKCVTVPSLACVLLNAALPCVPYERWTVWIGRCASYEYFDAFANYPSDVAVPVAIIAPRRILKFHRVSPVGGQSIEFALVYFSSKQAELSFCVFCCWACFLVRIQPFPLGEAQPSRLIITASSDGTVRVFGTFSPRFPKTLDL